MSKTIEEKAIAYDRAKDIMEKYLKSGNAGVIAENTIKNAFPELHENEDEIVKEELINYLKHRCNSTTLSGEERACNKWIDWLEKQDSNLVKNGYTDNKDVIKYAGNYSRAIWYKLMDNFKNIKDYHIGCNDVSDIVLNAIIDTYNWLEKQGKKEFTFKSIPRLLEMIELTDRAKSYCQKLIDSLVKEGYTADAKIVEACLKQMNGENVAIAVMDKKPVIIIPKFRVGDEVVTKNEESLTITRIDEEGYWSNDLFICGFDDSDEWELVEQKPYGQRKECLDCQFNYAGECKGSCAMKRNEQKPANKKELKKIHVIDEGKAEIDHCFTKMMNGEKVSSTWSEEDEKRLKSCLNILQPKSLLGNVETINTKWLKSLKQKHTWKPSDEQMIALSEASGIVGMYSLRGMNLQSLYNDLKKL